MPQSETFPASQTVSPINRLAPPRQSRKEPEPPVDPYAYVTAPKKPRPSNRSGAAVAELPED